MTLAVPLLTGYAGVLFLKERITKQEKLGTAVAVLGTLFTIVEPILESGFNLGNFEGNFLILLYMVADITSVILLKIMLKKTVDPTELTHISFIIGFLTFAPFAIFMIGADTILTEITTLPFKYHLGVVYMALVSGTLAYALRAKAQKSIEVSEAALFAYLTPAISAPLALVFLKESISPLFIFGAILVMIGVSIAEFKGKKE